MKELVRNGAKANRERERPPDLSPELCSTEQVSVETFEELEIPPEEGIQSEDRYAMGIELLNHPKPSWMDAPWSKVLDHQQLWEDPSAEVHRLLKKLFGRG
jgi:hypothetical protein